MPKDSIGNRLAEGQFVQVRFPAGLDRLNGRIKTINEGRITRIGGSRDRAGQITPGVITVEIALPVEFDPQTNECTFLLRVWDPTGKDLEAAKTPTEQPS